MKTSLPYLLIAFAAAAAGASSIAAEPAELRGMVVAVHDGDTITIDVRGKPVKVRALGIDAPEMGQPFAQQSRRALVDLCHDRPALVVLRGASGSRITSGVVQCLGTDIATYQVNAGMAWVNPRDVAPDSPLHSNQNAARQMRMGLWKDANPVAPWLWSKKAK